MHNLRVLVADDDRDFAESLAEGLEMWGLEVEIAYDGENAIDKVSTSKIDILILDLCMPKKSGLEVFQELHDKGMVIPTIVVTAYKSSETDVLEKLEALQVNKVMSKPVDPVLLVEAIMSLG